jgi:hypothetical protein
MIANNRAGDEILNDVTGFMKLYADASNKGFDVYVVLPEFPDEGWINALKSHNSSSKIPEPVYLLRMTKEGLCLQELQANNKGEAMNLYDTKYTPTDKFLLVEAGVKCFDKVFYRPKSELELAPLAE